MTIYKTNKHFQPSKTYKSPISEYQTQTDFTLFTHWRTSNLHRLYNRQCLFGAYTTPMHPCRQPYSCKPQTVVHIQSHILCSFLFLCHALSIWFATTLALPEATRSFSCIAICHFNVHFIEGNAMNSFPFLSNHMVHFRAERGY